jgi:hypothetical protein
LKLLGWPTAAVMAPKAAVAMAADGIEQADGGNADQTVM